MEWKNPSLFPMVGNTYTNDYTIEGKSYAMKNHGLIRYATLTCRQDDGKQIVMELNSNEDTKNSIHLIFIMKLHMN